MNEQKKCEQLFGFVDARNTTTLNHGYSVLRHPRCDSFGAQPQNKTITSISYQATLQKLKSVAGKNVSDVSKVNIVVV